MPQRLIDYIDDIALWMRSYQLQLNVSKTDLLWCTTSGRLSQLPALPLTFGGYDVALSQAARNDAELSLRSNIDDVLLCANCAVSVVTSRYRSVNRW